MAACLLLLPLTCCGRSHAAHSAGARECLSSLFGLSSCPLSPPRCHPSPRGKEPRSRPAPTSRRAALRTPRPLRAQTSRALSFASLAAHRAGASLPRRRARSNICVLALTLRARSNICVLADLGSEGVGYGSLLRARPPMGDRGWWAFRGAVETVTRGRQDQSVETRVGVTGSCGHIPSHIWSYTPNRDGTGRYLLAMDYGARLTEPRCAV